MLVRAFISLRFNDASSSDWPPDRNVTPGSAGTIVRDSVLTVYQAISWEDFLSGHVAPGVIMFGLRSVPSMIRL